MSYYDVAIGGVTDDGISNQQVVNLVSTTELKRKLTTVKSLKADVSRVSPLSERLAKG